MSYGRYPYGAATYASGDAAEIPVDTETTLAVEIAFTTDALAEPAWVDITGDVRSWDTLRGRTRELEPFQPGRATVVLSNLDRQYDSVNAAGPWYGNLKPMRRLRIRETFSGVTFPVFDGFVDRWQLDYPDYGTDAAAIVTATDAMKVFARTDLPRSVYDDAVRGDSPVIYWRLDETKSDADDGDLAALNSGSLGPTGDATYVGPPDLTGESLVVRDSGSSIIVVNSDGEDNAPFMGARLDNSAFDLVAGGTGSFVVEAWCLPTRRDASDLWLWDWADTEAFVLYQAAENFQFAVRAGGVQVTATSATVPLFSRAHVVARYVNGQPLRLWVNGTLTTGGTPSGAVVNDDDFRLGFIPLSPFFNWYGNISHVSIYTGATAEAVDQAWVDTHYAAGTAPWQDDLPGARIDRVLDEVVWPAAWREVDAGATTLQSADLEGQTALDHLQKVADTEFGLLYVDRAGNVRFVERDALAGRVPEAGVIFGDGAGEVGYRAFVPDDGDQVIRNRATISRLNGVAKTVVDAASVDEYGRFDHTVEGLLHRSDAYSETYAEWIVDEYADARRRITTLGLGPPEVGAEAVLLPQMLGRELGDAIVVRNRPQGGGDPFEQTCVIEGIAQRGEPGGRRETTWSLSPEFSSAPF